MTREEFNEAVKMAQNARHIESDRLEERLSDEFHSLTLKFYRIECEFEAAVLCAWGQFRPNGPLEGEMFPTVIQKIIDIQEDIFDALYPGEPARRLNSRAITTN